eukprot:CAMPEP_0185581746 /NCGR_PEP_ID=MMETSP0434-20130131/18874_1 /TAXON_ID=626734 ORGANISM="Favella taraikaensis, Strain Fe Narragansett Bay" /NCGR_SAMPLE_ID=MMETSP0434 /ASSEMBLY_ACC=CAM_ASM_000379 /LENGTH=100 /DNA_ID=CAMNT_0028200359 /DNA_START=672 /DNA_END=974 /DNA_ORIENTATION=-
MDQVNRVSKAIAPVLHAPATEDVHSDPVEVESLIHLCRRTVHIGVVPLQSLLDGQQEDDVDENYAVVADQEEHLEALGPTTVNAVGRFVHLFDQHVTPDV